MLTTENVEGDSQRVGITYKNLPKDLPLGARILVDDGLIELKVEKVTSTEIETLVVHGGMLSDRKGINVPGVHINLPILSEEDERDIEAALQQNVDFIAASFIRSAEDVFAIRRLLEKNKTSAGIIAKIESREGVRNFQEILEVADGVMIAGGSGGGDPAEDVLVQKNLIAACNRVGKPVITATQMLDSMMRRQAYQG